jgi:hypothetical protein
LSAVVSVPLAPGRAGVSERPTKATALDHDRSRWITTSALPQSVTEVSLRRSSFDTLGARPKKASAGTGKSGRALLGKQVSRPNRSRLRSSPQSRSCALRMRHRVSRPTVLVLAQGVRLCKCLRRKHRHAEDQ